MLIDDAHSAIQEAKTQLKHYPESKALRLALIKAFSRGGNEIEALEKIKAGGVTVTPVKDFTPFKNAVKQLVAEESPKYAETLKAIDAVRPKK